MDDAARFMLQELLAREPGLSAPEMKQRLAEMGINLESWKITKELEQMSTAHHGRRTDRRTGWRVDPAPEPLPEVDDDDIDVIARYAGPNLRNWQEQALDAWQGAGCRGVVEAITGTGKSLVGAKAIETVVRDGGRALVLVPSLALLTQWQTQLHATLPGLRMAALGDGQKGTFHGVDVLLASIQSAANAPPTVPGLGLVVADEVHRYGAPHYAKALHATYRRRLGLTGTYERRDDGVERVLNPYFGSVVFEYRYGAALRDGVVAPFHLALVGTNFTSAEREAYDEADELCKDARHQLISDYRYPIDPWAEFFAWVQEGSEGDDWEEARLCRQYLKGFAERRRLMAEASGKATVLRDIGTDWMRVGRGLVFTETVEGAQDAADTIAAHTPALPLSGASRSQDRTSTLRAFDFGRIRILCAPRILDEGIDVPEADLAVVVAASQTRRQMVQRMGRVIRLKKDGRPAQVVVMYVRGTPEDPARGGHEAFLEEVTDHAQSIEHFDAGDVPGLAAWLAVGRSA